jgi:hypothetical protein
MPDVEEIVHIGSPHGSHPLKTATAAERHFARRAAGPQPPQPPRRLAAPDAPRP